MSCLFLDPHGDDLALFCAYSVLREDDPVALVPYRTVPVLEVTEALSAMGCSEWYEAQPAREWDRVFAPAWHPDGHAEHNDAALMADRYWPGKVTSYTTYAPRAQRSQGAMLVNPEPWMVARKLRALSCFVSQIEQESTRPWFTSLLDVREWIS